MRVSAQSPRIHLRAPTTLLLCCCCLCWPVDVVRPTRFGEFPASRFWPETAETKDILRGDSPDFVGDHPGYTASFHFTPCLSHARPQVRKKDPAMPEAYAPTPWHGTSTCWATILATDLYRRQPWRQCSLGDRLGDCGVPGDRFFPGIDCACVLRVQCPLRPWLALRPQGQSKGDECLAA